MATLGLAWSEGRAKKATVRRESVTLRLARWAGRTLPHWKKFRSTATQLAGYTSINFAIFQFGMIAGFISVGVSLFLIDLTAGEK